MKILIWLLMGFFSLLAVGFFIIYFGFFDVSATQTPSWLEKTIASYVVDRSVAVRAPKLNAPKPNISALKDGLEHYRANCIVCHAAPGIKETELARGLNPSAPKLDSYETQKRTDGELYQIISNGIRMTGMPAFAPTHNEEELWNIVTFLRHLPDLTASEKNLLKRAADLEKEETHHH